MNDRIMVKYSTEPLDGVSQAFAGAFKEIEERQPQRILEKLPKLFAHF